jgi:exodeoxyribonuclease-5
VRTADFDIVLVFKNENRWKHIYAMRGALGKPLDRPVEGDRITFWKNNREENVFNGGSVIVKSVTQGDRRATKNEAWQCEVTTDTGEERTLLVDKRGFIDQAALEAAENRSDSVVASHSEALTVHKAQGSEWPRVLVADHPAIGWKRMPAEQKVRWRYTAVTRAQQDLALAHPDFHKTIPLPRDHKLDLR